MSSTPSPAPSSIRQRGGQNVKKAPFIPPATREEDVNGVLNKMKQSTGPGSQWDYKVALAVITVLAFATRFWGIGHPDQVVFDEVHFGKVRDNNDDLHGDIFYSSLIC